MLCSALGCEDVWWERCSLAFVQEVSGRWQEDVVFVSRPTYKALLFELPQDRGRRACVTSQFEVTVKCLTSIWFLRGCVYWL